MKRADQPPFANNKVKVSSAAGLQWRSRALATCPCLSTCRLKAPDMNLIAAPQLSQHEHASHVAGMLPTGAATTS